MGCPAHHSKTRGAAAAVVAVVEAGAAVVAAAWPQVSAVPYSSAESFNDWPFGRRLQH